MSQDEIAAAMRCKALTQAYCLSFKASQKVGMHARHHSHPVLTAGRHEQFQFVAPRAACLGFPNQFDHEKTSSAFNNARYNNVYAKTRQSLVVTKAAGYIKAKAVLANATYSSSVGDYSASQNERAALCT